MADKTQETIVVRGISIEGVTKETLNDFEFMEVIAVMGDPDADDSERLRAIADIAPIIFGRAQWRRIKAELREQNGGKLPVEAAMGFINDTVMELNAKN